MPVYFGRSHCKEWTPVKRSFLATLFAIAAALVAHSRPAAAQEQAQGFTANKLEPSDRGSDWFTSESLDLRGTFRPAIGVVGDYEKGALHSYAPNGDIAQRVVSDILTLHAGAAVNLFDRLRLAASIPLSVSIDGQEQTIGPFIYRAPAASSGIGDLRFGGDLRVAGVYGDAATIAVSFRAWAPTGNADAYLGDGRWRFSQGLKAAGDVGIVAWSAHVAHTHRVRSDRFDDVPIGGNGASFGATVGLRVLDKRLLFGPELVGSTLFEDPFAKRTTPVEALFGAHFSIVAGLRVGAGIGTGLLRGIGAPELRGLFALEWFPPVPPDPDRDVDHILDKDDACPDVPGKPSDDPAKNGCPEATPQDKDGDGVTDDKDACVDVPGVETDDPKTNGCPRDGDRDGVLDKDDACPDVAGPKTDDPKTNGCPDADGDGIVDKDDACPNEAGRKTDDPKTNGCPDNDLDKDGIANADDACPDEPGQPDPDPKKNGCPKAFIKADEIKIIDQVKFKTGSAQILPGKDSEEILQAVFKILADHPEIKKVRVEGHTDNRGPLAVNMKLSAERAASVVKWFVDHGIARDRLTSEGFGPKRPTGPNTTEAGRRDNRRVEFHIEKAPPP
jgi:OmpA-OmpF porin, OOP family